MKSNEAVAVTVAEFVRWIEELMPPAFQEHYDNSGLQAGDPASKVESVLLTVDVTASVIEEAVENRCNLIVSHHPPIFTPMKRLTYGSDAERAVAEALKNNISIYSAHTSFDNMAGGVSHVLAQKIGLEKIRVLVPLEGRLSKLVTFVPQDYVEKVKDALYAAGAGNIGKYDRCSFNVTGVGTYRAGLGANPFAGGVGEDHSEPEIRLEVVMPSHLTQACVMALLESHPYEEVAYDIIALENRHHGAGAGAIGTLPVPMTGGEMLERLKQLTGIPAIRYSGNIAHPVKTVAVCGGSGASYINDAAHAGADAFFTGDIKYHTFASAPPSILVADIGHYESEKFSLEILRNLIHKKFPNFALRFSGTRTNPINYFQ